MWPSQNASVVSAGYAFTKIPSLWGMSKFRINVRVSDQQECHLLGVAMVSDYVASTFFREGVIGGLSAFRYFFTVFLWTPVSRVIPLIDRPLRFAA